MSCKEAEIAALLPFYAAGTLAGEERARVEEHVQACASCRAALATFSEGATILRDFTLEAISDHIGSEELVDYCHDRRDLNAQAITRIERHLQVCAVCANDVALLMDMNRELGSAAAETTAALSPIVVRRGGLWKISQGVLRPAGVAAAIVILLTAVLIGYWIYNKPRSNGSAGIPHFTFAQEDLVRGNQHPAKPNLIPLKLQPRWFLIDFPFAIVGSPGFRYDLEVLDAQGLTVLERRDIRSVNDYGYFSERFEQNLFSPGQYVLVVKEVKIEDGNVKRVGRFTFQITLVK